MFFFIYKGRKFQSKEHFQKVLDAAVTLTEPYQSKGLVRPGVKNRYDINNDILKRKSNNGSLADELKFLSKDQTHNAI